ncbi:MAG: glycerol-3-phosphate dehydrogenase subunit GlpB [Thermodesulfobacteriota bacterium]
MNESHDYDCLIIGGGLAGLTCGLACLEAGLSCAVVSSGMSALHFSSGSIDLLGYNADRTLATSPVDALPGFIEKNPDHPYARCGAETIMEAMAFFGRELEAQSAPMYANGRENHFHITAMGTLKPTFLSPASVFTREIRAAFEKRPAIAILDVKGFRDFHPGLAAANLRKNKLFADCPITCGEIELPGQTPAAGGARDMRSVDVARILDATTNLEAVAGAITAAAGRADIVALPAFLGLNRYQEILAGLRRATGRLIYEIPTLPPSILGMRLDQALKSRFAALGGVFIARDTVDAGRIEDNQVISVHTTGQKDDIRAACYVLASGSFFSKGLVSRYDRMFEPVFDCRLDTPPDGRSLSGAAFLSPESHAFIRAGVITDGQLNPQTADGRTIANLFCAGAVLAGYNPVIEGCGGGVAIATGYAAAKAIRARLHPPQPTATAGPQ